MGVVNVYIKAFYTSFIPHQRISIKLFNGAGGTLLSPHKQLAGDDADAGHRVQLLKELEAVGILQLLVHSVADDLQEGKQHTPCLALEHCGNQVSWGAS